MQPSLFLSHGAPTLAMSQSPAADFLRGLPGLLPQKPTAIIVASAHWEAHTPTLNAVGRNNTIHDFGGFPAPLYAMRYDAPGDAALAQQASALLQAAGMAPAIDPHRGLDHGAWVPLILAWPETDIPVLQLSIQSYLGAQHHIDLGRALAPLRAQGVLIVGSGSWTHSLRDTVRWIEDAPEPGWVLDFADWADAAIMEGRVDDLKAYRALAPNAARNHPTEEHFLPLFVALGAGGGGPVRRLHRGTTYGVLHMDAYAFG